LRLIKPPTPGAQRVRHFLPDKPQADCAIRGRETAEHHFLYRWVLRQRRTHRLHCDQRRPLHRTAVNTRANGGKGHAARALLGYDFQAAPVTGGEEIRFAVIGTARDRFRRMDDKPLRR